MSETVRLSNFATVANAVFNSITANATAIQSMSVGGHTINATAFTGNANTATFANGSATNTFTVGTAAYFVANGNVGIGVASPGNRLTLDGGFLEVRSGNDIMMRPSANDWDMRLRAVGTRLDIYSGGAPNTAIVSFLNGGNVGIGTTSPGRELDVVDASRPATSEVGSFGVGATATQQIRAGYDTAGHGWIQSANFGTTTTPLSLNPVSGNVGVGTTSPNGRLQVSASTNQSAIIQFEGNSNGNYPVAAFGGTLGYNFSAGGSEVDLWNIWTGAGSTQGGFMFRKQLGASSNQTLLSLRGDGVMTVPGQPFAYVDGVNGAFETTGTTGVLTGGSAAYSTANFYNATNGRFTVPVAGNYLVTYSGLTQADNSSDTQVTVNVNGTMRGRVYNGGYSGGSISWRPLVFVGVFKLAQNDFIEFNKTLGTTHAGLTYRTVYLLG